MFTGIVQAKGGITALERRGGDVRLSIRSDDLPFNDYEIGESIAVNGVCLTAVALRDDGFDTDVSIETLDVTSLGSLAVGGQVNLDTRFMRTRTFDGVTRLVQGGLFSLDGMHPTITGYGLVAETVLREMRAAGVQAELELDWDAIVAADTLLNDPPGLLSDLHALLTFLDKRGLLSTILELF